MKILLYGNGGAGNHGCEAIVRGTVDFLGKDNKYLIHSIDKNEDERYGLNNLAEIYHAKNTPKKDLSFLTAYIKMKLLNAPMAMDILEYNERIKAAEDIDFAFSVGGDNYCYGGTDIYGDLNKAYHKNGKKTVFWGCSVEPDVVADAKIAKDLKLYNLIVARESITYEAIKEVNPNTVLCPDPAFFMKPQECKIDKRFESGNVIGINLSPMIISNEKNDGITLKNYKNLVEHILKNTESCVALIPHVVWDSNDDRKALKELYDLCEDKERIILVEDHTAPELKYIISKCEVFVGARTHSTIAAYSTGVPTLVVGYSVKAKGIARDLFGTEKNYVLPVQALKNENDLKEAFDYIYNRKEEIRTHLTSFLPGYLEKGKNAVDALKSLIK